MNLPLTSRTATPAVAATSPAAATKAMLASAWALCALLAAAPAQATLQYGSAAYAEGYAVGVTEVTKRLSDPLFDPRRYDTVRSVAGAAVEARTTDRVGNPLVGAAYARASASTGGASVSVGTTQEIGSWPVFEWSMGRASAQASTELGSLVSGAPGATGKAVMTGRFLGSVGVGPFGAPWRAGGADLGMNAFLQSFVPGSWGCRVGGCIARDHIDVRLRDGASMLPLDRPWRLEIDVRAGDQLQFVLGAYASAAAGYGAAIGNLGGSPFAASYDMAAAEPLGASDGATRLWLSPGLSLADEAGLVRNVDGSYGFAAPVPEPASLALMLGGLVLLFGARRCRGRAAEYGGPAGRQPA